jgi:hypothetical protein
MKMDDRKTLRGPQVEGLSAAGGVPPDGGLAEPRTPVYELVRACGRVDLLRPEQVTHARALMVNGCEGVDTRGVARKLLRELLGDLVS